MYIIQSEEDGWTYTGHTKDIQKRLREHNNEKTSATRLHKPFKLVYAEECTSRSEAMKREKFLKTGKGRDLKKELLEQGVFVKVNPSKS